MAITCRHCLTEQNTSPDISIYHIEGRTYRHKTVMSPTGPEVVNFGDAESLEVTEYLLQECTRCSQLMLVEEVQRQVHRVSEDE